MSDIIRTDTMHYRGVAPGPGWNLLVTATCAADACVDATREALVEHFTGLGHQAHAW